MGFEPLPESLRVKITREETSVVGKVWQRPMKKQKKTQANSVVEEHVEDSLVETNAANASAVNTNMIDREVDGMEDADIESTDQPHETQS